MSHSNMPLLKCYICLYIVMSLSSSSSLLEEVKELYLEGAHQNGEMIDPDLQTGLGVLFHLNGEFNRAIDAFSAALTVRPEVCILFYIRNFTCCSLACSHFILIWPELASC